MAVFDLGEKADSVLLVLSYYHLPVHEKIQSKVGANQETYSAITTGQRTKSYTMPYNLSGSKCRASPNHPLQTLANLELRSNVFKKGYYKYL